MQLIRQCEPKNVVLVHGEKSKMFAFLFFFFLFFSFPDFSIFFFFPSFRGFLKQKIQKEFGVYCYDPPNGMTISFPSNNQSLPIEISSSLMKKTLHDSSISESNTGFSSFFFSALFNFFK